MTMRKRSQNNNEMRKLAARIGPDRLRNQLIEHERTPEAVAVMCAEQG